jgi:hypothetical protein
MTREPDFLFEARFDRECEAARPTQRYNGESEGRKQQPEESWNHSTDDIAGRLFLEMKTRDLIVSERAANRAARAAV